MEQNGGVMIGLYSILMEETANLKRNNSECASSEPSPPQRALSLTSPLLPLPTELTHCWSIGQIEGLQSVGQLNIYSRVFGFISEITNTPSLLFDILKAFRHIQTQLSSVPPHTVKFLTTRKAFKTVRTSLNELQEDSRGKEGRRVHFREEVGSISIKLINSRNQDLSRQCLPSNKENISAAKLVHENTVVEQMESAEELGSGQGSKGRSFECGRCSFKKISIVMFQQVEQRDSELFSSCSRVSLRDIELPQLKLTQSLIEDILDCPSPFLATLALSLLLKFFMRSRFPAEVGQIGWLLGISTLVAYKVFFDETIEGLVEYYSRVLGMRGGDLRLLQRWFLEGLNYEVVVSNRHYMEVMMRLLASHQKQI